MNDSLVGLNKKELNTLLTSMGVPEKQLNMRTNQLWNWIYVRGATSIDEMTNLSKEFRSELSQKFTVSIYNFFLRFLLRNGFNCVYFLSLPPPRSLVIHIFL